MQIFFTFKIDFDQICFWQPIWKSVKIKPKKYFSRIDFLATIYSLTSKLHHWGHTKAVHFSYINGLGSTRALLATPHQNTNRDWRLWFLIRFSYLFNLLLFWRRQVLFILSIQHFYYSYQSQHKLKIALYEMTYDFIPTFTYVHIR